MQLNTVLGYWSHDCSHYEDPTICRTGLQWGGSDRQLRCKGLLGDEWTTSWRNMRLSVLLQGDCGSHLGASKETHTNKGYAEPLLPSTTMIIHI